MANRDATNSSTTPKPTGLEFLDEYSGHIGALYDNSVLPLTNVSGTDTITADVDPELPAGGLASGMKFCITWPANNTGAVTLNIGSVGAAAVVDAQGGALTAGAVVSGARGLVEYTSGKFYILNAVASAGGDEGGGTSRTVYDASGVWTNDVSPDAVVMVQLWGAGGGGRSGSNRGGGGGAYAIGFFRAGDLGASETVTVPAGGAVDTAGGNCTFGSHLTAFGGGAGSINGVGGGGGEIEAGTTGSGGSVGGGDPESDAKTAYGGGGGASANAGSAVWGGAGGGATGVSGGKSAYGGDGGDYQSPGERPGGGGGSNAAGGGGRCIITVFGG